MATFNAHKLYILTELREAQGITLEQMAKYCDLKGKRGREAVSLWEQGRSKPRSARRPKLLEYLHLYLKLDREKLLEVWDTLIEEWDWDPLDSAELQQLDQKTGLMETVPSLTRQYQDEALPQTPSKLSIRSWQYNAEHTVAAVAISADGQSIVAGTLKKNILSLGNIGQKHWQVQGGNQVWRVALSADGQTVVGGTGSTRPWDMSGRGLFCFANNGSLRWRIELGQSVWGLALSADGNTIAIGTSGKQLMVFDGQGNRLWEEKVPGFGPYALVWSTALSADGQVVVAGAADKHIRLFERSGVILAEHQARGDVFTVTVSADGEAVAAGDGTGYIYWLNRQGHLLWKKQLADTVWATVLNGDGTRLLVGAGEKEAHLRVYDEAGRLLWRRYVGGSVSNLAFSADGHRVAAGTRAGGIYIFGEEGAVLHQHHVNKSIRDVAISASGEQVVAGSENGYLYGFRLSDSSIDDPISAIEITPPQQNSFHSTSPDAQVEQLKRQLPLPTYTQLFGVESFTDQLVSCLDSPQHQIITIQGIGGIGKTALADHGVRTFIEQNKTLPGLLWISAKQEFLTTSGIVGQKTQINLDTIFDDLGQKLSLTHVLRLPLPQKIDRIAAVLRQTPYLVIIDNLETIQDFQGLVPWLEKLASPTKFLLTSREYIPALTTVTTLHLEELSLEAGLALIRHTAQEKKINNLDIERVYELVGGNPLAIILIVSQMQVLPPTTVLESVKLGTTEDIYRYVYQKSWSVLDDDAKSTLLTIQRAGDQADWDWLSTMLNLSNQELQNAIQHLLALSLVQSQRGPDNEYSFAIHRLTSTFLRTEVLGWK